MSNFSIIFFVILLIQCVYSQNISGNCGAPITQMIPSGVPVYGNGTDEWYSIDTDFSSPKNVLSDGVWCASFDKRFVTSDLQSFRRNVLMCSSADWNGTASSASNKCGLSYSETYVVFSTGTGGGSAPYSQIYVANNLCEKVNSTTGGLLFYEKKFINSGGACGGNSRSSSISSWCVWR